MNRSRIALAALAFGGASLIAPAVASANPWIGGTSSGSYVPIDGAEGSIGQQITVSGNGCTNPTTGEPAYMGEFVSLGSDPLSSPSTQVFETQTDGEGAFEWDVTIPAETPVGRYVTRWYCSTAPVTSLTDPAMLWVSPVIWMDVGAAPAAKGTAAARTSTLRTAAAASAAPGSVTLAADQDALPSLDRLGIDGPKAAALKAKVDAAYAKDARGLILLRRLAGRNVRAAEAIDRLLDQQYVASARQVLGAKRLPAATAKGYAGRLTAGEIRVNIVEDLALTVHPAAWYNAR